jgi:hypothetical protein
VSAAIFDLSGNAGIGVPPEPEYGKILV